MDKNKWVEMVVDQLNTEKTCWLIENIVERASHIENEEERFYFLDSMLPVPTREIQDMMDKEAIDRIFQED